MTSDISGPIGKSPQYLNMQSKHSTAKGSNAGSSNFNKGPSRDVPCHFTRSVCCFQVHSFLFSFDFNEESILSTSSLKQDHKHIQSHRHYTEKQIIRSFNTMFTLCCTMSQIKNILIANNNLFRWQLWATDVMKCYEVR